MKTRKSIAFALVFFFAIPFTLISENASNDLPLQKEKEKTPDIAKLSEAFGHMIGKNLLDSGAPLDIAKVIQGLRDSSEGKSSPLSENECIAALSEMQEESFKNQSQENLQQAESFLQDNSSKPEIVALENGKVQYRIEKEGSGKSVEERSIPLVHYSGKLLDGSTFGASQTAEALSLNEIIPGLKSALIGMKEGEKRTIFIHPELAYGTTGYLPPNSLLTFEIEVVKAHQEEQMPELKISTQSQQQPAASPQEELSEPLDKR